MNRGTWWATVHRVTKTQTQLKRHSMHKGTIIIRDPVLQKFTVLVHVLSMFFFFFLNLTATFNIYMKWSGISRPVQSPISCLQEFFSALQSFVATAVLSAINLPDIMILSSSSHHETVRGGGGCTV